MPLSPRTEKILKRTLIGVSIVVATADLLILTCWLWLPVYFLLLNEDTLYGPNYSEKRFDQVKVGMTEAQVKELLGLPLKVIEESNGRHKSMVDFRNGIRVVSYPDLPPGSPAKTTGIIYFYSQPASGTADWYVRTVSFTPQWIVSEAYKSYYVD